MEGAKPIEAGCLAYKYPSRCQRAEYPSEGVTRIGERKDRAELRNGSMFAGTHCPICKRTYMWLCLDLSPGLYSCECLLVRIDGNDEEWKVEEQRNKFEELVAKVKEIEKS